MVLVALFLTFLVQEVPMNAQTQSPAVSIDASGRLVYAEDEHGNRIPDFSNCGYKGGGVEIPEVYVVEILLPEPS